MPCTRDYEDDDAVDDDDSDIDPEGPDPEEMDSSDDPDLDVCPHCRKMISEDAEQCPHCRQYILPQDQVSTSTWIVIGTVLALAAILFVWVL
jgi:hypothetical protein